MELKIDVSQLRKLVDDLKASQKSTPVIAQKVLSLHLRSLRSELRSLIPRQTGQLQKSFGFSVRRKPDAIVAHLGFFTGKRVSARTAIAANVLQLGGARPRKGKYLWIPIPGNQNLTPRQFIAAGGYVRNQVAFQRGGIPAFVLKTFVKLSRPPVPIEARAQARLPQIEGDITESIAAIIEARKAAVNG